ncbi:MAG: TSUP family transporter, partial [Mycobacteriales bacterium]
SDVLAKGTSLLVIIPTALVGTARNVAAGNTDVPVAVAAGLAGAAAAFPGSVLAVHLDPSLSRALFALLLVGAAAQLLLRRPV